MLKRILNFRLIIAIVITLCLSSGVVSAKEKDTGEYPELKFEVTHKVEHTSIKSQGRTGTCWSFAAVSFLESEIIRLTGNETDLSEMYIARMTYPRKAEKYVRLHGRNNLSQGGQAHDALDTIKTSGIVPEKVFPGLKNTEGKYDHSELARVLSGFFKQLINVRSSTLTPYWQEAFDGILNAYIGTAPAEFELKGKKITPQEYAKKILKINPDDYIEITSYNIYPFGEKVVLDIPDNWSHSEYLNVKLDRMEKIIDSALKKGFSVCWDGDTSDKFFSAKKFGYAIVPADPAKPVPFKEKKITQKNRQVMFDNYKSTDDHLMHIVGLARDENGNKFYLVKNSWGTKLKNDGYIYMSRAYLRLHTVAVMIHKAAMKD